MKFRIFKQDKLWRDKAVDLMTNMGSTINWIPLNDAEFVSQLKAKLIEEAHEVSKASTREALMEELADILEVIQSFSEVHNFTLQDLIEIKAKKFEARGGFQGRRFVTTVEHPVGSFGERYCLADPDKNPEVI